MKKINTHIILIIIVFSSHILGAQTISKVDLILKEVSNELNKLLPSQINENSKVLSVVAIGNKTLLYSIEMTINPSLIEITNQTDKIKNSFRTNPVYSLLRENKINIIYNYKNPKGEFLFDIKFNCGDLDSSNKNQIKLESESVIKKLERISKPALSQYVRGSDFIIPNKFGEYFYVNNNPKSISNFRFKLPYGFKILRDGRDNSTINVFRNRRLLEKIDFFGNPIVRDVEFTITTLKWRDFPKYQKMMEMSDVEIQKMMLERFKNRNIRDEVVKFYEKNNQPWTILVAWNKEKNLYIISTSNYSNKQAINLTFKSSISGESLSEKDINSDIRNIKLLINSFEFLN